jgi:diguanylate cyclase (GGDEF)-like protein
LAASLQAGILRVALHTDRALAGVREQRDRDQLAVSQHVLEMSRALSDCQSLTELTREVSAYLPRLNVSRCFLVLLEAPVDRRDGAAAADPAVEGPIRLARLAMSYRDGEADPEPDPASFAIDGLLPPSLAGELERGTLTVQPLFNGTRWFGILLHEQTTLDRHTGEALRLDASRVLDAINRARELTERAAELEQLVAVRTEQLEQEVATRRTAQEDLREANDGLRRALLRDGLTGLNNRPSFDEHLSRAWHHHRRSGQPLALLMIDVDHFKLYNDTYGHLAGDECLRRVATCLRAAITRSEDVVARFGGEEFAVILPDTGPEGAGLVADRLLRRMRTAAIAHVRSAGHVSVSIGFATTGTTDVTSAGSLLEIADQALYRAKQLGRDRAASA